MKYKPFITDSTEEIIKEIKSNLQNIEKSQILIDTLDVCHMLGEIEILKDKLLSLETERDVLKSTLSDTKADIKYLLQHGENIYIRRKYIRGEIDE